MTLAQAVAARMFTPNVIVSTLMIAVICMMLAGVGSGCDRRPPAPPSGTRIVALTPSTTEIVAALGALPELVGVDDFSSFPPEVIKLPKVGSFMAPSLEAILRLRPSIVLVDDAQGGVSEGLAAAGLTAVKLRMHTLADVRSGLEKTGAALGRADAARAVVAELDAAIDAAAGRAAAHTAAGGRRLRILAVIDRESEGLGNMVAAGPGSYLDELLAILGVENVLASSGVRYPKISAEEILRAQPDVIVDASHAALRSGAATDWREMAVPAVQRGRILLLGDQIYMAPGPRAGQALTSLGDMIYGDGASSAAPGPAADD
jgi:iron complex transport system substrate-binding protein